MSRKLSRLLWSWKGRVPRAAYFWASAGVAAAFVVLFVFLETAVGRGATWILYPPFIWSMLVLAVKRLHDRGQSAWWLAVAAIPLVGPLWLAFVLLLRKGSPGENQYGPDPLATGDYLTVDIHRPGGAR